MRLLLLLLCPVLFSAACKNSGNETKTPPATNSTTSSSPLTGPLASHDPFFVETTDTVSPHGPASITRGMLRDRQGNIWLASWEGIFCYDGKSFINYTLKAGLRHFHAFSVMETKNGVLWFGTIGGGAYRYDGKTFTNFTTNDGLPDDHIQAMQEDADGNIWFATDSGAARYNEKVFTRFSTRDGLPSNEVISLGKDRAGNVWIGTQKGICIYNAGSNTFTPFPAANGNAFTNVRAITEDHSGNLWIGSNEGWTRYDGKTQTTVSQNFTSYIFEDHNGTIWSSGAGINENNIASPGQKGMALYRYNGNKPESVHTRNNGSDSQIFGITEDNDGHIWFGTVIGACRYDGKTFRCFSE